MKQEARVGASAQHARLDSVSARLYSNEKAAAGQTLASLRDPLISDAIFGAS
jgi:hypothetical protein